MPNNLPPTTITISPFSVRLLFDRAFLDREAAAAQQDVWGYVNLTNEMAIVIDPSLVEGRKRQILLHEIGHAILEASGYGHPKKIKDIEQLLNVLSSGLLNLLRENHQLVRWLSDLDEPEQESERSEQVEPVTLNGGTLLLADKDYPLDVLTSIQHQGITTLEAPLDRIYIPQKEDALCHTPSKA